MRASHPVPLYGLAGDFAGTRRMEGYGRDLVTVVHRSDGPEVSIGVDNRMTSIDRDGMVGAISEELVRKSMAPALVADLPSTDRHNLEERLTEAEDSEGWTPRNLVVDG